MYVTLITTFLCFTCVMSAAQDSAVRSLVYTDINVNMYDKCARLMNATDQIGCQSAFSGDVGVLFHVNQSEDISKPLAGKYAPYIILIHADYFNKATVKMYQSSGKVRGIIVYSDDDYKGKADGWSPEFKCPRYRYGLYNSTYGSQFAKCDKFQWNPVGNALTEEDIDFPVFIMKNDTVTQMLINCHDQHNLDIEYPLCAARMKSNMNGALSTETCRRRNQLQNNLSPAAYCDVIGGHTIVGTLQVTNSSSENYKPIILITAALDSRSFEMTSYAPGANSITGFVSLLAVAHALGNLTKSVKESMSYDVVFVLFDGESFDNMGSVRMVYDMSKNSFPFAKKESKWQPENINISRIKYVIEIGQVGLMKNDLAIIHYDPISVRNSNISTGVRNIVSALKSAGASTSMNFKNQTEGVGLVPSSFQSILRAGNVSGVVITDFDEKYKNNYFNSRFDTPDKLGVHVDRNTTEVAAMQALLPLAQKIVKLSDSIAKAVFHLATNDNLAETNIQENDTAQILYCYYYNAGCSLAQHLIDIKRKRGDFKFNQYVGVYSSQMRPNAYFARNLLALFLSEGEMYNVSDADQCKSDNEQDEIYKYLAFKSKTGAYLCLRSTVYDTDGRSPSAVISNYDYGSRLYGAWTESRWSTSAFELSIFLVQDSVSQGMILLCGLLMLAFSIIVMYLIHKKSQILFAHTQI